MSEEVLVRSVGSASLFGFVWRHKYWFIVLLVTLPMLISSIHQAIDQKNPLIPFTTIALRVANADGSLYNDVEALKSNPSQFIGMDKPDLGIWAKFKYYFAFFMNVIWKIFGTIFLISLPFVSLYKFISSTDTTSPAKNLLKSVLYALIFMFFMNLIFLIHGLIRGTIILNPPNVDFLTEVWWIVKLTLPFHGVANLVSYIIGVL